MVKFIGKIIRVSFMVLIVIIAIYTFGGFFNLRLEQTIKEESAKLFKLRSEIEQFRSSVERFRNAFQIEEGIASWYGKPFHGRITSNGETYNMFTDSVAHKSYPHDTWAIVINLDNGKSILVRVNDRGPFIDGRIIDLSYSAFKKIADPSKGLFNAKVLTLIGYNPDEYN